MYDYCGVINVYKEKGYTSHDVVAIVRKMLAGAKTGHTGTLDPQAEGVLPVCIGKATKISEHLASEIKAYRAVVNLGTTTDTLDFTGTVIAQKDVSVTQDDIKAVVATFQGEQLQTPPMYSAIKVGGRKLYDMARAGVEIERKQRQITIFDISIVEFLQHDKFVIDVTCSKGTYIRSLCHDIGEKLGCGANMGELIRTRSGNFHIEQSRKLDDIKQMVDDGVLDAFILPIDQVLPDYKKITVGLLAEKPLYNGNLINVRLLEKGQQALLQDMNMDEKILVYDEKTELIGLYVLHNKDNETFLKPVTMLR